MRLLAHSSVSFQSPISFFWRVVRGMMAFAICLLATPLLSAATETPRTIPRRAALSGYRDYDRHEGAARAARWLMDAHERGENVASHLDAIEANGAEIEKEEQQHLKRFEETGKKLRSIEGIPTIVSRHEQALHQFREKSAEVRGHFNRIRKARRERASLSDLSGRVRKLRDYLEEHRPRKEYINNSMDSGLPWRVVQPGELQLLGSMTQASGQKTITASTEPPLSDDLSATTDVQITPEIQALAANLHNSPLEIFRHVYNGYQYVPYYGSMKGSLDTYWEKEGNDYDLASLLIALLRASNISARYVRAEIIVPMRNVQAWLGMEDPMAAAQYLASARIPCGFFTSGTTITHVKLEHIYAEAYIPYGNYRGTGEDTKGSAWVPMDPSFKKYNVVQSGIDISAAMGFDWKSFSSGYLGAFQNITPLDYYNNRVNDFIAANYSGKSLEDLTFKTELAQMKFDFLPNTLPYQTNGIIERFSAIPASQRHTVRFTIPDVLDYTTTMPELSGRRITLSFTGATAEDQATIDSYGGIFKTPPYLIKVVPVIRINSNPAAQGSTQNAGTSTHFSVIHTHPDGTQDTFNHNVLTGSHNAVGITTGKVRPEYLSIADVGASDEDYLPRMLHSLSMKYHDALGRTRQTLNETMRMRSQTFFTEALVSTHEERTLVLGGAPVSFTLNGFVIDAKDVAMAAMPVDGKDIGKKQIDFAMTFGHEASYQENRVFEDNMFWLEGTSAVKGFQMLKAFRTPIVELQPYQVYANANLPEGVVSDINNALNMGWKVMAPENTAGLSAVPYIKYDESTGSSGFMLAAAAGGLANETMDMTWLKDFWQKKNIIYNLEVMAPESPHLVVMGDAFMTRTKTTATVMRTLEKAEDLSDKTIITDANFFISRNRPVPMCALIPGEYKWMYDGKELFKFIVTTALTIDSTNTGGLNEDGTYADPSDGVKNDLIEENAALFGKLIPLNIGDKNNDSIPDFADGYDLTPPQFADNGSAAFVPILVNIPEPIDLTKAQITFDYIASAPDITPTTNSNGSKVYTPNAPGHIRLWTKDGGKARKMASVANGGNFIKPGERLTVAQLGAPISDNPRKWRFYIEGVSPSSTPGEEVISYSVSAAPFYINDKVRATVAKPLLVTDYNRDRIIDANDRQIAALGKTFYFWVNDNNDKEGQDINSESIPGTGTNGTDQIINGMNDLEDFFPVQLDIQGLLQKFPSESYDYRLKQEDSALNFAFAGLTSEKAGTYLTDAKDGGVARLLAPLDGPYTKTYQITKDGIALNSVDGGSDFLKGIADANKGVILVEGRTGTDKPLVLEIVDKKGRLVLRSSMNISIAGVEDMFRHKNLMKEMHKIESGELPLPPGVTKIEGHPVPDEGADDRLDNDTKKFTNYKHFKGFDKENDDINFIHVHGYNVNGQVARGQHAQAFKRLFWAGSKAKFWGITWYGYDSQKAYGFCVGIRSPNYHVNVRHAFNTGVLLMNFVNGHSINNVTISAHSLGNMVVSTAIKKEMQYDRYLMVNPAVAEEGYVPETAYASDADWLNNTRPMMYDANWRHPYLLDVPLNDAYQPFLWASEWYKQFSDNTADDRSKLTWRGFFQKVQEGGKVYAFFAPTDQAFRPFTFDLSDVDENNSVDSGKYLETVTHSYNFWDFLTKSYSCSNDDKIGTYSWSLQELLKGQVSLLVDESNHGGWGFNYSDYGAMTSYCEGIQNCVKIDAPQANALKTKMQDPKYKNLLKMAPLFDMNPDNAFLYTDQSVTISEAKQMELLANEIPALTFAVGHRGTSVFKNNNINIRDKYLKKDPNTPWPRGDDDYEWRHSDYIHVAYPYVYRVYNDWVKLIKGEPIQ